MTAVPRRRVAVVETVPAIASRRAAAGWLLAGVAAYVALIACAAAPTALGLAIAAAAVTVLEDVLLRRAPIAVWAMHRIGFGAAARALVRGVALVLFAARESTAAVTVLAAVVAVLVAGAGALRAGALQLVEFLRTPPVMSRGLDLQLPPLPGAPPAWACDSGGSVALVELVAALGLALSVGRDSAIAIGALVLALACGAAAPAVLLGHALRLHRLKVRTVVTAAVQQRLLELRPEVVAYLGVAPEWQYQLEMWLPTLEALDRPTILMVRDHEMLRTLAPTTLPLVSAPGAGPLMQLDLPALRAALYVGNAGNNIHLLRRPGVCSVFIGHGDSDKGASSNPFSRVYNEIWVAGDAGRDRYLRTGAGFRPEAFVAVGRPQLPDLRRAGAPPARPTVLYAPTWEGWGEDDHQSSLPHVGVELVRRLLARGDVRVLYRPHPRAGSRDAATRRAHEEVLRLLRDAGAQQDAGVGPAPALTTGRAAGDLLDLCLAGTIRWSRAEHDAAVQRWIEAYWAAAPGHRILVPPAPDLFACFAVADALVGDISSVTSDFLAADRPYAVVDTAGVGVEQLHAQAAAARGGFVLDAALTELDALVTAAAGGADPTATARQHTRQYLLGPHTADPAQTFRANVDRLCDTGVRPDGRLADPVG